MVAQYHRPIDTLDPGNELPLRVVHGRRKVLRGERTIDHVSGSTTPPMPVSRCLGSPFSPEALPRWLLPAARGPFRPLGAEIVRATPRSQGRSAHTMSMFPKRADLRRHRAATPWDKETISDQSRGVPLSKIEELSTARNGRLLAKGGVEAECTPQFVTEIEGSTSISCMSACVIHTHSLSPKPQGTG
jgi:hypothetical protein